MEQPDFGREVTDNLLMGTHMGPIIKHANWALTIVNAMPESFSGRWVPGMLVSENVISRIKLLTPLTRVVRIFEDEK